MQRQNLAKAEGTALLTASRNYVSSYSVISEAARCPPVALYAACTDELKLFDRRRVKVDDEEVHGASISCDRDCDTLRRRALKRQPAYLSLYIVQPETILRNNVGMLFYSHLYDIYLTILCACIGTALLTPTQELRVLGRS